MLNVYLCGSCLLFCRRWKNVLYLACDYLFRHLVITSMLTYLCAFLYFLIWWEWDHSTYNCELLTFVVVDIICWYLFGFFPYTSNMLHYVFYMYTVYTTQGCFFFRHLLSLLASSPLQIDLRSSDCRVVCILTEGMELFLSCVLSKVPCDWISEP